MVKTNLCIHYQKAEMHQVKKELARKQLLLQIMWVGSQTLKYKSGKLRDNSLKSLKHLLFCTMQYNSNIKSLSYSTLFFSRYNVISFDIFTTV